MATIGRYEISDQIGTGSMGIVYRARDMQLDREVALKTIRTGIDVEPEIRERFFREARACARLQHPAIITVYDLGEDHSLAYIAMELLKGSDFRQLIKGRTEIPLNVKVETMIQICEALGHAHRHGIIHRDVKPSNLFFINQRYAKVLDFGIARLPSSHLTVAGKILGTPNYMSPEQILGKPIDAASDLFSAAIVFFELLVYAHPFQGQSIPRRIVETEPDSLFDYDTALPALFEKIFARALAKDGSRRYRSGEELAADLRALLDGLKQSTVSLSSAFTQLPSERAAAPSFPEPTLTLDVPLLEAAPSQEDPNELRLSEIMRLIPEFEQAMERGDRSAAQQLVLQLESIEAVDHRFSEALVLCRSRLASLPEPSAAPAAPPPKPVDVTSNQDPITTPVVCAACGEVNRSAARFCRACGESLTNSKAEPVVPTPAAQEEAAPPAPQRDDATRLFVPYVAIGSLAVEETSRSMAPQVPVTAPTPQPAPAPSKPRGEEKGPAQLMSWAAGITRKKALIAAAALGLIVILAAFIFKRPVPLAAALASASVSGLKPVVYKSPAIDSGIVVVPGMKDRIRILRPPRSRDQEWVQVQYVSPQGHVFQPGYMRTGDLDGWDSEDAPTALGLIRIFSAEPAATEPQIDAAIALLRSLQGRIHDEHVSREAGLLIAELEIKASQNLKAAGTPLAGWQARLVIASTEVEAGKRDPVLREPASGLQARIDELSLPAAQTAPVEAAPQVALVPTAVLLEQAEKYRHNHNFDAAENVVQKVLRREPKNAKALQLQDSIKESREFFQ